MSFTEFKPAEKKTVSEALSLDPNNESAKQNIRMAEEKLKEQHRSRDSQSWSSADHRGERRNNSGAAGGSRRQSTPPQPFASMQFDSTGGTPVDITSVLRNIGAQIPPGQHFSSEAETEPSSNGGGVPMGGGNVNLEFGEEMPEEFSGALQSIMNMFSGAAAPPGNPENNINGRSAPPS